MKEKLFSQQAEREVIGGMIREDARIDEVLELVGHRDFGHAKHRLYVWAIEELTRLGQPVDVLTITTLLESAKRLDDTDMADLSIIVHETISAANVVGHAKIVRNFARRRKFFAYAEKVMQWTMEDSDPEETEAKAQKALMALGAQKPDEGPRLVRDILPEVWADLDRRQQAGGAIMGMPVNLPEVDALIDGLNPGLYVLAARPAMGKSVFALQCAYAVASQGKPTVFFSLEMSQIQKMHRLLAASTPTNYGLLQSAKLTVPEWDALHLQGNALTDLPLWIDDASCLRLDALISRARRLHCQSPLGLIVVDYLQLVTTGSGDNRVREIGDISRGLKILSGELKIPIIAVSQLNRELEKRPDKRPFMSDLRESGSLEQDADVVMFLYRDEIYNPPDVMYPKGYAEFIVRKNRFGEVGTVPLRFKGVECRFDDASTLPPMNASPISASPTHSYSATKNKAP